MSNSFTYNGLGQRTGKVDSTGTFTYTRTSDAIDGNVLSDGAARYVNGAGGLISEVRGGASKYYHADGLGSTRAITNASATVTDTKTTDAFGLVYASTGTTPTPFGFAGKQGYQSDADTGLMLLGNRYYDSSTGRFLSRDPIQAGRNWYVYCENDPINDTDSTGLQVQQIIGSGGGGAAAGVLVGGLAIPVIGEAELIAGGVIIGAIGIGLGISWIVDQVHKSQQKEHDEDQKVLVGIAKDAQKKGGVSEDEAKILVGWGLEYGLIGTRGPEVHPNRPGGGKHRHIHVGPVNHLHVK